MAGETANVLHILLVALLIWNAFWTILLLPYSTGHPPHIIVFSVHVLLLMTAVLTLRRGWLRRASCIYLAAVWLHATSLVALNTGIRSPILALYVTLPVSAAWLLGYRASLWTTAICLLSAFVFAALEMAGVAMPRLIPATAIGIWLELAAAVLMGVVPLAQVLRALQEQFESLHRQGESLRESEARFRTIANAAPVMIGIAGPDKSVTFLNKRWLEFRGRTMEQESGHGWVEGLHPDDRPAVFDRQPATPHYTFECRFRRADGEYRWLLCTAAVHRERPEGFAYICSAVDTTEVKQAHEKVFATQKFETLGTLASGIAHDFNNILAGVLAQTEVADMQVADGLAPTEELKLVRALVTRGAEVVRQLMIYAGKEADAIEFVDVSGIVDEMTPLLKALVSKHVRLEPDLRRDLPAVQINSTQLRQIVMNLVTNASDAIGDHDGVIRLRTRQTIASTITDLEKGASDGPYVELEVTDTGSGMTPEARRRIFDPFFTTKASGRGLGLAVVQGIVHSVGGEIHVVSKPGKGSAFIVSLPCRASPEQSGTRTTLIPERSASVARQATILVVEDEDSIRDAVSRLLRRSGLTVIEAGDGSAGLIAIRTHDGPIDALLLDITLPGASSDEVFREARRLRPETRVIATSAHGEEVARASLYEPPDAFIRKPCELGTLLELIAADDVLNRTRKS